MKTLWRYIDERTWSAETKYRMVMLASCAAAAVAGLVFWLIVRMWVLSTVDWMLCFIGYPAVVTYFLVFLYGVDHEFHDGTA